MRQGKVYLVGAGPGDAELLTRKALRLIETADVILHDALVSPEILALASPGALLLDVGKRCGRKKISQEEIHCLLISHARAGKTVVRLKGGDPLIFGRAGEEIEALRESGINFEIAPGVTAALAAAAAAQVSLTHRQLASCVVFLTGHHSTSQREPPWDVLAASGATLAIYMPGEDYGRVAQRLLGAGMLEDTPCLIVSAASMPHEKVHSTCLARLAETAPLAAPAVLLVGAIAASTEALEAKCALSGLVTAK